MNRDLLDLQLKNDITLREYLKLLLVTLWREGESFSGKRPFGNSSWQFDVYGPMIEQGFIGGTIDEYGDIIEIDTDAADALIIKAIEDFFDM